VSINHSAAGIFNTTMEAKTRADNFLAHHQNVKLIEQGIALIQGDIKHTYIEEYIVSQSKRKTKGDDIKRIQRNRVAYVRILSGIIVSWSESLLKRLIHEPNAFLPEQIDKFHKLQDAREKWRLILKMSFCNKFLKIDPTDPTFTKITRPEDIPTIKKSLRLKYASVHDLISNEIFPSIDLRNKVQHGEWKIAFNPPHSIVKDGPLTAKVNKQNIRTLQTLIHDIESIYKMIVDIATFSGTKTFNLGNSTPFEHFFDGNYERIEANKKNLLALNETEFKSRIQQSYARGIAWRKKNSKWRLGPIKLFNKD
jgi:hypothetical protein